MLVLNAMFSRKKGGIEQAFVDYAVSLSALNLSLVALCDKKAPIISKLPKNIPLQTDTNWGAWDFFAKRRLSKLLSSLKPDIIITHGNRASSLLWLAAFNLKIPIVCVCHNYTSKLLADYYFCITQDLKNTLIARKISADRIFIIPNMLKIAQKKHSSSFKLQQDALVIGAMGRFVAKKGFKIFLQALYILKSKGFIFKCNLAGDGEELSELKKLAADFGLSNLITFTGWVEDKKDFYEKIDIFCLPSTNEPFGIVLLEAMSYALPIVSTDTVGPKEILLDQLEALIVKQGDENDLANKLAIMLEDSNLRKTLGANALKKVTSTYSSDKVGKMIKENIEKIIYINADTQDNKNYSYHLV